MEKFIFLAILLSSMTLIKPSLQKSEISKEGLFKIQLKKGSTIKNYDIQLKELAEALNKQEEEDQYLYHQNVGMILKIQNLIEKNRALQKYTNFDKVEENCILVRKYVRSMPFNNKELDDSFYYKMIRDKYKPISYRTLTLKLLQEQTFFGAEETEEIEHNIFMIRKQKKQLLKMLHKEKEDYFLLKITNQEVIDKAQKIIEKITEQKTKFMQNISEAFITFKNNQKKIRYWKRLLMKQDPFLEAKIQIFKLFQMLEMFVKACTNYECVEGLDFQILEFINLIGLKKDIEDLIDPLKLKNKLEVIQSSLQSEHDLIFLEKTENLETHDSNQAIELTEMSSFTSRENRSSSSAESTADRQSQRESAESRQRGNKKENLQTTKVQIPLKRMGNIMTEDRSTLEKRERNQIKLLIHKTKYEIENLEKGIKLKQKDILDQLTVLKKILYDNIVTKEYRNYMQEIRDYKQHIKAIIQLNKNIKEVMKNGENLVFLVDKLKDETQLDVILPFEIRFALEEELTKIEKRSLAINQISYLITKPKLSENREDIQELIGTIHDMRFFKQQDLIDVLQKRKVIIDQIEGLEEFFDKKLAELIAGTLVISYESSEDGSGIPNRTMCFSEIELGRNFFMMAKTNVILNFEVFMREYLSRFSYTDIKNFALMNYAVFVKKEYLGKITEEYQTTKAFELEERIMKEKLVSDFVYRFSYLISLYKDKVDSLESIYNKNFVSRQFMFIWNGLGEIKSKLSSLKKDVLVDFLIGKIVGYIISVIPFISTIPFLQSLMNILLAILLNEVIRMIFQFYQLNEFEIKKISYRVSSVLQKYFFKQKIDSLNYFSLFNKYDWIYSLNSGHGGLDNLKKKLYSMEEENQNSTKMFEALEISSIENKYNEILNSDDEASAATFIYNYSNRIKLFNQHDYLLSVNRVKMNEKLIDILIEQFNLDSNLEAVQFHKYILV